MKGRLLSTCLTTVRKTVASTSARYLDPRWGRLWMPLERDTSTRSVIYWQWSTWLFSLSFSPWSIRYRGNTFFGRAVTLLLSQRLSRKTVDSSGDFVVKCNACKTSRLNQETQYLDLIPIYKLVQCSFYNISCAHTHKKKSLAHDVKFYLEVWEVRYNQRQKFLGHFQKLMYLRHKSLTKRTERRETIFLPPPLCTMLRVFGKTSSGHFNIERGGGGGGCLSTETVEKLLKLCECPKTFVTDCSHGDERWPAEVTSSTYFRGVIGYDDDNDVDTLFLPGLLIRVLLFSL